ncbi:MAG: NADH-quinone oxidoreductase subunit M [Candidatus Saganbacteria bacterium]|nr:NADH-quinone oxidoreductase subunit M [Candidatus Saganbacteria bacterium]
MGILENFLLVLLAPLFGAVFIFFLAGKFGRTTIGVLAFAISSLTFLSSLAIFLRTPVVKTITIVAPWVNVLGLTFSFYFDVLTMTVLLISTFVTSVALLYSIGYFKDQNDFSAGSFYSLVLLFLTGIIGVFVSANLILFYLFWELMLLPTFAITAYFGEDKERSGAIAIKYFIFTHIGAVLILAASLLLYAAAGTADFMSLKSVLPLIDLSLVRVAVFMFIVGFGLKMAIFPLHSWLPDTYTNAPTPATVIMASVMMNASIYGFIRFFFTILPRDSVSPFIPLILVLAVISQYYGAILAMVEKNIKRMIAYSSISQMGYVLFGIGTLTFLGVSGATFHIINHTIIKALLFMTVGAVFMAVKKYDTDDLGGLMPLIPMVALTGSAGALAIAGVPLFGAFQSEWMIFAGGFRTAYPVIAGFAVAGALFTAAYSLRFIAAIFFGEQKLPQVNKIPAAMIFSMSVLALSSLLIGVCPWFFSKAVQIAVKLLGV